MIQPYLTHPNWSYVSVDGLIWLSSGLGMPSNLEEKACAKLIEIYTTINTGQPLVIDFRNIIAVADRALEGLFKIFEVKDREVILVNYEPISEIIDKTTREFYTKESQSLCQDGGLCYRTINHVSLTGEMVLSDINNLRHEKVTEFVRSSFSLFSSERYLKSTPIQATGVFDASKLISDHTAFYWVCLELSEKLKEMTNSVGFQFNKEVRLLTVNLKSSPFASVVSLLRSIPLVTIDHLGPKHKVYDLDILDGLENMKQYSYIYLGDFCIGGTEIKIAKTYAGISNSELDAALVIGAYFDPAVFKGSFNLNSLVSLNGLHSKAKFSL